MTHAEIAAIVGLALGLIFSFYVRRKSIAEEKIYGGTLAQVFHYLGVLAFCMTLPTVISAGILRSGFLPSVALGFTCVILAFVFLLIFAVIEQPARAGITPQEEVWTEEKARDSGMLLARFCHKSFLIFINGIV
jgi:hypothetical protein